MSGEAVVVSVPIAAVAVAGPVLLAGGAIAGTALVGAAALKGVAAGVGTIIEQQAREARRRADEERARIAEWHAFEQRQREAMAAARDQHDAIARMQQRLMAVQLREPVTPTAHAVRGERPVTTAVPPADRLAAQREAVSLALNEIADALDAAPPHPASPVPTLRQQVDRYRRQLADVRQPPPETARIAAVRQTAEQSIARFQQRLGAEADETARRVGRADAALRLLLVLEQLPRPEHETLRTTRHALLRALEREELSAAALEQIEEALQGASQRAAERLAGGAVRPALAESLLRHLQDMGYAVLQPFPDLSQPAPAEASQEARVRIPGGEQVAIKLDADARLRFNLMHERATAHDAPLSPQEVEYLRTQEQHWCRDLKALVGRLVEDGFDSQISFERPCTAVECTPIPTVVVEHFTADEAETEETPGRDAGAEEERRRRMRQAAQRKARRLP